MDIPFLTSEMKSYAGASNKLPSGTLDSNLVWSNTSWPFSYPIWTQGSNRATTVWHNTSPSTFSCKGLTHDIRISFTRYIIVNSCLALILQEESTTQHNYPTRDRPRQGVLESTFAHISCNHMMLYHCLSQSTCGHQGPPQQVFYDSLSITNTHKSNQVIVEHWAKLNVQLQL